MVLGILIPGLQFRLRIRPAFSPGLCPVFCNTLGISFGLVSNPAFTALKYDFVSLSNRLDYNQVQCQIPHSFKPRSLKLNTSRKSIVEFQNSRFHVPAHPKIKKLLTKKYFHYAI